ncbi:MAG: sigma-70 family RNA polymerase sigma factor, partial [Lachnospiraceae bacterium]|nr:sigma-70 family RNA polymerase sigma factor [Lachnospiraceae bacterium]
MSDDDRLYEEFLHGKTESFDELMIRYGEKLTMYLRGYLASYEDAEDMMIEAFSRIMFKKPKIEKGNFKVYLFRTAH